MFDVKRYMYLLLYLKCTKLNDSFKMNTACSQLAGYLRGKKKGSKGEKDPGLITFYFESVGLNFGCKTLIGCEQNVAFKVMLSNCD